ncbi:SGNH hydrolase domain-containing protein, partial [Mesorhizobium japonicum]|uniref:SGNH hydrolase domain-containing protein n=1 Tax=Mesorhizobium japonicum TaxID=2066070 RepID=UPI003B59AB6B
PTEPPTATPVVASNLTPSLRAASDDNPAIYAKGCEVSYESAVPHPCVDGSGGQTIVLFGDSHAAEWYPALHEIAARQGDTLVTQTKSACASIDVTLSWSGAPYTACAKWRENVIQQLKQNPPDLVILANYGNADFNDKTDPSGQWRRGLESTIKKLQQFTRVAVIADTPDLRESPTVCLSGHLRDAGDCARPASLTLDSPGRTATRQATAATGTPLIDLTGYFCTTRCAPIIGNVLVYRDSHHITASFARAMTPALSRRLVPILTGAGT